ncbi:ABC transporter substrate-binding protein [Pseudomonas sp. DTU_2021_1001937_2_SI_NGA_ILE_001]|uniref:ABC transporter substrate-binding protein n=1 Tax=Pseudomonas sp. DTU_2021_1001937_2_SI_NGA_ILE_001 TaxID=3077589 RepID=UPI0028FC2D74|nr:ABC transporter substrate-binding protein [Pseudomonas sp. DTU_2021_1001937_2_SI_NGA_ILE_001]WNW12181.1 ABC transporter substrate-binding protein [Pseudomonas sp. DTU_2021_1001937_2_SI_NGA_ILE_001]
MSIMSLNRRRLLALAGTATAAALVSRLGFADDLHSGHAGHTSPPVGSGLDLDSSRWVLPEPRKVKIATNLNAVCLAPVAVADSQGIFKRHNLDVEFVNFGNSTEVLLESMATGKADAATGMALRWLKALEQGFDVKLTAGTHGGCLRLLTLKDGPQSLAALKGSTIGVTDMAAADKNFFSLMLKRHGVDPIRDVTWRVYPIDLLSVALEKGEIQAASGSDPIMYRVKQQPAFRELATNMIEDYANMSCCVVGVSGKLARNEQPVAAAITHSILQAHAWAFKNPDAVAEEFLKFALNTNKQEVRAILTEHTHGYYSVGKTFEKEIAVYARDLKQVEVLRPRTDPVQFAESIHADVFA